MSLVTTIFIIYSLLLTEVASEAFSSTANIVHLVEGEATLVNQFEIYLEEEEKRLATITEYVNEMKLAANELQSKGSLHYAGHPINAYSLLKRWSHLMTLTKNEDAHRKLAIQYENLPTPTDDDVVGAIAALLRLQRVFSMETEDMAKGKALFEMGAHTLSKEDCLRLGNIALENSDFGLALQWLEHARKMGTEDSAGFFASFAKIYKGMGDFHQALAYATQAFNMDLDNTEIQQLYSQCKVDVQSLPADYKPHFNAKTWHRQLPDWRINYEKLCRGEIDATSDPNYAKTLFCRYRPSNLPYVVFKEEILSWEPRIGMFHDVISETEAHHVINMAYPKLYRAKVGDPAKAFATSERISKVAWLWDTDSPVIKHLSERVSTITGLATEFRNPLSLSEPFQVVNYGMGGQYEPHTDFYENPQELANVPDFLQNTGDRISTFLYYLSQIRHGGATVFPNVNIRVPPVKNAAAFWYNFKLNGEPDNLTQHAGCPVLIGQKWVVNKWIRQRGQEFRRKCGLTADAIDKS